MLAVFYRDGSAKSLLLAQAPILCDKRRPKQNNTGQIRHWSKNELDEEIRGAKEKI